MARYSDKKPAFCDHITFAFAPIERAAQVASETDRRAVKFAAIAVKFARQWTVDTTEASRRECAKAVALLEEATDGAQSSQVSRALLAYSKALKLFLACDYRNALRFADMAKLLAR
jgi:hypothetical protein